MKRDPAVLAGFDNLILQAKLLRNDLMVRSLQASRNEYMSDTSWIMRLLRYLLDRRRTQPSATEAEDR